MADPRENKNLTGCNVRDLFCTTCSYACPFLGALASTQVHASEHAPLRSSKLYFGLLQVLTYLTMLGSHPSNLGSRSHQSPRRPKDGLDASQCHLSKCCVQCTLFVYLHYSVHQIENFPANSSPCSMPQSFSIFSLLPSSCTSCSRDTKLV